MKSTKEIIKNHVIWSLGGGLIPIPIVDFIAVTSIQLDMIKDLCSVYGINFDKKRNLVFVASPRKFLVKVFHKNKDNSLTFIEDIDCKTGVDNIEFDTEGNLWIGAHPNLLHFAAYAKGDKEISPSEIIKINYISKNNYSIEQIYVDEGAKMATHLGNGCANEINRHDNPLWPQLSNDDITASIIADGFHLRREEVRTFYKAKGVEKTILVSDAIDLAGLTPGEYTRGERTLLLTENVVKLPKENVLAGAASPISKCVGVVMDFTGCSLKNAIQMASSNPAKMFSLDELGTIEQNKRADLILFTLENNEMIIKQTFVAGELVYTSQK